jgi:hypothetical protein
MHVRPFPFASCLATFTAILVSATALDGTARADGEEKIEKAFEVSVAKRDVIVTAKGEWHINKDFPWKLVIGDIKLDRSKFELGETTATVHDAPSGTGKLRGAVCSKDVCRTLERDLTIP